MRSRHQKHLSVANGAQAFAVLLVSHLRSRLGGGAAGAPAAVIIGGAKKFRTGLLADLVVAAQSPGPPKPTVAKAQTLLRGGIRKTLQAAAFKNQTNTKLKLSPILHTEII